MVKLINKSDTEYYICLFDDLKENMEYHFLFEYANSRNRFNLQNIESIIFYKDCLIIFNKENDRFLFNYENMDCIEIICMGLVEK